MAEAQRRPDKRAIVDALVLAFSHSDIRSVVGTDALRSVLDVEYKDMLSGSTFDLAQLWELLQTQPGFTADAATPPMCVFKSWESRLGIEVKLPAELAGLSASERTGQASVCRVPTQELRRVLKDPEPAQPGSGGSRSATRKQAQAPGGARSTGALAGRISPERRRILMIAAGVITLVCFVFVGLTIWRALSTDAKWQDLPAGGIAGTLPVSEPARLGDEVGTTLTDPDWMALSRGEREEQLRVALESLRPKGVRVLFVRHDGDLRAAAEVGRDGTIRYRFY
jgi:hypothetical protein